MINKCKVEMIGEELYNVKESLREEDEKIVLRAKRNRIREESSILVFSIFGVKIIHALDRIGSLRPSS